MQRKRKEYRSQRALKAAFVSLARNVPYSAISVQSIIDQAQYSKSTFYVHFSDKEDLLQKIIEDEVDCYVDYTTRRVWGSKGEYHNLSEIRSLIFQGLEDFFTHVYQNQELYRCFRDCCFPGISLDSLAEMNYNKVSRVFTLVPQPPYENLDMDLYLNQCCHTYMQYVRYWVDHNFAQSPKYMAEQAVMLLKTSVPLRVDKINLERASI